jgi:hypothetical protein
MDEFKAPPVSAPLYRFEPGQRLLYPDAELLMVMYGVDRQRAAELVPPPCEIPSAPKTICLVASYGESFVGPYREAATLVEATVESSRSAVSGWFVASMYVDTDAAMAAGREIYGFPKKLAEIEIDESGGIKRGRVRRGGVTIMDVRVEPSVEVEELPGGNVVRVLNLKLVPRPDLSGTASAELTTSDILIPSPGSIRVGAASIDFEKSADDPIHVLEPGRGERSLMGALVRSEFELSPGRVVRKLV